TVAKTAQELSQATRIILPGVGAFDWAMMRLNASGMRECLDELVVGKQVPVLGICVGMQMMAKRSDEGKLPGLGWVDGEVKLLESDGPFKRRALPHMGWNDVAPTEQVTLFKDIANPRYYFLHSYHFVLPDATAKLAEADYHGRITCAVRKNNIYGVQFHPEKSHEWGVSLLRNFSKL
ncbi:MAG: imidazole glycerol phosphate synthase subunit HisH, partial [Verrucomicrobiota bacterium]